MLRVILDGEFERLGNSHTVKINARIITATNRNLEEEIRKFQDNKKGFAQKIESLKAAQAEKKKSLFADVEKKLKEQLEKK